MCDTEKWVQIGIRLAGLLAGLAAACLVAFGTSKEREIQREIASEVVRFHVKANSDTVYDQQVKRKVRDGLLETVSVLLKKSESRSKTEEILKEHLPELTDRAEEILRDAGSTDCVQVELASSYFPEKTYGEYTLPAGNYQALQVKIGEARGHNWWCMLYPALCFTDSMHPVLEEEGKEQLKNVLSDEAYTAILKNEKITFRFYWF